MCFRVNKFCGTYTEKRLLFCSKNAKESTFKHTPKNNFINIYKENIMKAYLVLEDGFSLEGESFTGEYESCGEVIFNTGMTGYQEILTDPSYTGQMVCMTYPLIGNYGINAEDMESGKVHVAALIVKECCKVPSNWRSKESLPDFLKRQNIPGIEGIDTRALTVHIRNAGALRGIISTKTDNIEELLEKVKASPSMQGQNLVPKVAPKKPYIWDGEKPVEVQLPETGEYTWQDATKPKVIVYDFGIKWNILRQLDLQGIDMLIVPPSFTVEDVKKSGAEAIFLSNGPGDPATLKSEIETIKELADIYPIGGICLGHQLLGHALGGTTEKLKFGHHGCNNPVKDLQTGRIEISSQNHGFIVINDKVITTHINLNDNTVEGFKHPTKPIIAVQHHPEAAPGPTDARSFFCQFRELLKTHLKK